MDLARRWLKDEKSFADEASVVTECAVWERLKNRSEAAISRMITSPGSPCIANRGDDRAIQFCELHNLVAVRRKPPGP